MNASEAVGKILIAQKSVRVYKNRPGSNTYGVISPGKIVGKIYSWTVEPDGLYWQLETENGENNLFVKHNKNTLEVREQKENDTIFDKVANWLLPVDISGLPTFLTSKIDFSPEEGESFFSTDLNKEVLLGNSIIITVIVAVLGIAGISYLAGKF